MEKADLKCRLTQETERANVMEVQKNEAISAKEAAFKELSAAKIAAPITKGESL
jgi:hypothetical protein